ncbi:DUF5977 domain-containing protein [Chryseobacterium soli]|uniref:DUF5977 domain-containing protein n=1 Tax=Chryseobacterium soli TaxID=445961 RepID=UPI0029551C6F|nr:DUF5977 domain-containing protein [Chryseobacterium soli]MDV7699178.1 DUF5977 domain-containing protein [Chryseobacterium soli]
MKKYILIFIIICNLFSAQALNIKSPQSYEIERFGNIPVNLNAGGVDVSIPIFEKNFSSIGNFKVSLDYNSSGFMPNKKSNYVGYNWSLNFGGAITRDINGIADDSDSSEDTNSPKGFLVGVRLNSKTNIDIYDGNFSQSLIKDNTYINGYNYELKPDRFNFNFMGVSGYFYVGNNGIPIIVSNDMNLKIDISNLSNQQNYGCTPAFSEITITDGKGIKYYFGGHHDNLEVTYQMGDSKQPAHFLPNGKGVFSITSWYLKKIEYPNNHILEIEYAKYIGLGNLSEFPDLGNFCTRVPPPAPQQSLFGFVEGVFNYNKYVNQVNSRMNYNYNTTSGGYRVWGDNSEFSYQEPFYQYSLTKKVVPIKVLLDGKLLIMFYTGTYRYNDNNYGSLRIFSIGIRDQVGIEQRISFDYERYKDLIFLSKVKIPDEKSYTLSYYNLSGIPKETTLATDFWGYWNGKNDDSNSLIPTYKFNTDTGDYEIIGDSRNPNPELVSTGMLKSIVYPTGGRTSFYYEPHKYSRKIERDFSSNFLPYLKNESGSVGGARISKIIDFDGVSSITRDFKYIKNYGSSLPEESSGIASQVLRYMDYQDYKNQGNGRTAILNETANNISENSLSSSPINYSEVAELKNNILQKKYYFSDYSTNPDSLIERTSLVLTDDVKPYALMKNFFTKPSSNDNQRGKLLKVQLFNEGNVIQEIENKYSNLSIHPLLQNKFISQVKQSTSWVHYQKEYMFPYFLKSTIVKDYRNSIQLTTETDYIYDNPQHLNLTEEKVIFPGNDIVQRKMQYAEDLRHGNQPQQNHPPYLFLPWIISINMTGIPLIISNYKNNVFQNRSQFLYERNTDGLILPKKNVYYSEDKTYVAVGTGYNTPTLPLSSFGITEVTYDKYDNKANLQQYTGKDGIPVTIIWGYNQTEPIAKIEGAQLSDIDPSLINSIVAASDTDASRPPMEEETALLSAFDLFRNNTSLSNYLITMYTYDPFIGIRSITPPSGIREYYKYDTVNRLEKIVDANNKIIREYAYKKGTPNIPYTHIYFSVEKSKVFTRNNCTGSTAGGSYMYTVPAGAHSSDTSQLIADQKALDDINNNGQNIANQNGPCMPIISCSFTFSSINPQYSYNSTTTVGNNVNFYISFSPYGIWQSWANGINIGKVGPSCAPSINRSITYNEGGRQWKVFIDTSGNCTLTLLSGTVDGSSSSPLNFMFQYQK